MPLRWPQLAGRAGGLGDVPNDHAFSERVGEELAHDGVHMDHGRRRQRVPTFATGPEQSRIEGVEVYGRE
jgi:hypothetical protein